MHTTTLIILETVTDTIKITIGMKQQIVWALDWYIYQSHWLILNVMVKVMYISTMNMLEMIEK